MESIVINGDARHVPLADRSVQCVVTSPPYFGLRDYGIAEQIGMEKSPADYVAAMVQVFREVWRVLRDDGVCWLNLGDSYANDGKWGGSTSGKHAQGLHGEPVGRMKRSTGLKAKDLIGIPWRVAFALEEDGWYLRSEVIWHKPNPMPESVTDRPTKAHEQVFLLTKAERYFYDAEAVKEPSADPEGSAARNKNAFGGSKIDARLEHGLRTTMKGAREFDGARNMRSVWSIAVQPYRGAHFATMPPALAERCILAGTSERGCCPRCGAPYERIVDRQSSWPARKAAGATAGNVGVSEDYQNGVHGGVKHHNLGGVSSTKEWRPTCDCDAGEPAPCVVFDPFNGSGTTGKVALELGRRCVGVELNPAYIRLAQERQTVTVGMGW